MSESVDKFWKDVQTPLREEEGSIMVTTADGKGVVMRSSELAQKKKDDGRVGNKKMSLVGSVYTVDPYARTPEQVLSALFKESANVSDLDNRLTPCHQHVRAALLRDKQGKTDLQSAKIFDWMANEVRQ